MGIEVNPGHRNNPIKQFIHNPTFHRVLRVTGVALAALAALAGVVALSLFVAPAFAALIIPVTFVSIILLVTAGRKSSGHHGDVQPGPGLAPSVLAAQRELEEATRNLEDARAEAEQQERHVNQDVRDAFFRTQPVLRQEIEDGHDVLRKSTQKTYKQRILKLLEDYQDFKKALKKDDFTQRVNAETLRGHIQALEVFYTLQARFDKNWDLPSIHKDTKLESCLRKAFKKAKDQSENSTAEVKKVLSDLVDSIREFADKHDLNLERSDSSSESEESSKAQEPLSSSSSSESVEEEVVEPIVKVSVYEAAADPSRDAAAFREALKADQNRSVNDPNYQAAMHAAALNGFSEAIEMLHESGMSINQKDLRGFTPLHLSFFKLLESDPSINEVKEIRRVFVSENRTRFAIPAENPTEKDLLKEAINTLLNLGAEVDRFFEVYCTNKIKKLKGEPTGQEFFWPERKPKRDFPDNERFELLV